MAELARCGERPVGVAQHFAADQNEVGLAAANDVVGLLGRGDQADRRGRDRRFAADLRGELGLVAGADRHSGARREPAA